MGKTKKYTLLKAISDKTTHNFKISFTSNGCSSIFYAQKKVFIARLILEILLIHDFEAFQLYHERPDHTF